MDEKCYQFYCFHYSEFVKEKCLTSKLSYDDIVKNASLIQNYFYIFKNIEKNDKLARFKISYACKILIINIYIYLHS